MSALGAMLAGMAVFSNSRPPDGRINQVMDELDELKALLNQLQKSVLQLERKIEKDTKAASTELREVLEKVAERIDKRLMEMGDN
jgi:predicted  nucleic acid-binding Zn-ribbon protein